MEQFCNGLAHFPECKAKIFSNSVSEEWDIALWLCPELNKLSTGILLKAEHCEGGGLIFYSGTYGVCVCVCVYIYIYIPLSLIDIEQSLPQLPVASTSQCLFLYHKSHMVWPLQMEVGDCMSVMSWPVPCDTQHNVNH